MAQVEGIAAAARGVRSLARRILYPNASDRVLPPVVPTGLRIYAVADIHGSADCLADVFERIDSDKARFPIDETLEVYLGDYVDRGPQSRRVIEMLLARAARHPARHLLGNHEAMLLDALDEDSTAETWRRCGGPQTLRAYGLPLPPRPSADEWREALAWFRAGLPPEHVRFLRGCGIWFACGSYLFVHAGIRPGTALDRQDPQDLLWIREPFLRSNRRHGAVVVHGHTPVREPEILHNRINLDTGAYLTGRLACLVLEGNAADVI